MSRKLRNGIACLCLLLATLPAFGENIPASSVIKVCGMPMEFDHIVKNKCKNGKTPQVVDRQNVGPLTLPETEEEATRASEQAFEINGLKPGEPDFHNIDRFTLSCGDKIEYRYFDLYHCEK